jgi:outer membrane protein OmpA-like peptidoglycan-associated protein
MWWLLASLALADDTDLCKVDRPVSIDEFKTIMNVCIVPVGTRITVQVEEVEAQVQKPGIGFRPNDTALNSNGKSTLDGVAGLLSVRKKLYVKVVGYADPQEQGDLVDLSYRRAEVAAKYIVDKGIDPARVIIEAGGVESLIDHTDTADGRARNRRVEFVVSVPEPIK